MLRPWSGFFLTEHMHRYTAPSYYFVFHIIITAISLSFAGLVGVQVASLCITELQSALAFKTRVLGSDFQMLNPDQKKGKEDPSSPLYYNPDFGRL